MPEPLLEFLDDGSHVVVTLDESAEPAGDWVETLARILVETDRKEEAND